VIAHANNDGPKFPLGQTVATPGALAALEEAGESPSFYLSRHQRGDWGLVCDEDKAANEAALNDGSRVLSAYELSTGVKIWILTEASPRSSTTLLLPEEY